MKIRLFRTTAGDIEVWLDPDGHDGHGRGVLLGTGPFAADAVAKARRNLLRATLTADGRARLDHGEPHSTFKVEGTE